MCGIAGILGPGATHDAVQRMNDAQRHRGPDDEGIEILPVGTEPIRMGLGHRRLSILDLSTAGHQPMREPDGGPWIVFNGEIYNHRELRRGLGGSYQSTCDTETLLRAFRRWGPDAVLRLRGMFAFAIWDPECRELFLCRDRLGVKPLYYAQVGDNFLFANELRAILASGLVSRKLDPAGLDGFLSFGTVPEPRTILRDVKLLPAGHWMRVSTNGGIRECRRYWVPPYREHRDAPRNGAAKPAVASLVREAVACRLLSDVPLGAFLSGGIDSSAIVSAMASADDTDVRTFTLHFNESGFGEGPFAELVAKQYKTRHTTARVSAEDLLHCFDEALDAADQPSTDGINSYYVSKLAKQSGITVALCGHGGDELFGGYDNFRLIPAVLGLRQIPRPLRRITAGVLSQCAPARVSTRKASSLLNSQVSTHETYALARGVFWDDIRAPLLEEPDTLIPAAQVIRDCISEDELAPGDEPLNQVSQLEIMFYMKNSLLRDTDVCSMAHGLEVRLPLLDHHLVEFVAPLPGRLKTSTSRPKHLLIDAMGTALPPEIQKRRKQGFVIPFALWMRGVLRPKIDEVLHNSRACQEIGLRPRQVQRVWARFLNGDQSVNMQHPLALYVALRWCERHGIC